MGYFIAHESHHRGNILLTLKQCGHRLDQDTQYAIWDWTRSERVAVAAETGARCDQHQNIPHTNAVITANTTTLDHEGYLPHLAPGDRILGAFKRLALEAEEADTARH